MDVVFYGVPARAAHRDLVSVREARSDRDLVGSPARVKPVRVHMMKLDKKDELVWRARFHVEFRPAIEAASRGEHVCKHPVDIFARTLRCFDMRRDNFIGPLDALYMIEQTREGLVSWNFLGHTHDTNPNSRFDDPIRSHHVSRVKF